MMHFGHDPRPLLEDELQAFVDGRLDDERRREVQDYLDRHPDVAQRLAELRLQRQSLIAAFDDIGKEPLPRRLDLRDIAQRHRASSDRFGRWKIAATVTLAVGIGGAGGWLARGGQYASAAGIASLSREASASFATYALDTERPVEIDGDHRPQLVDWVSRRLRRQVPIPDLGRAGYRLLGGRLVATEHGPAALFIYDDARGTRLAVLARPMTVERDTPSMRRNDGPYGGWTWSDHGLGYSVVGDEASGDLHPLADELRHQVRTAL